jgi:hypothetical protein
VAVVARVVWQKEPERWEDGDFLDVDPAGALVIRRSNGEIIDIVEAGDWIDARGEDGRVIEPPQAF